MYYVVNYRHCDISLLNTLVCTSNNLTTLPHDHNTILTRNKINSNPLIFFNAQSVLRFPPHLLQSVFESQFKKKKTDPTRILPCIWLLLACTFWIRVLAASG